MNDRIREQARLESKQASACLAARLTVGLLYRRRRRRNVNPKPYLIHGLTTGSSKPKSLYTLYTPKIFHKKEKTKIMFMQKLVAGGGVGGTVGNKKMCIVGNGNYCLNNE